MTNNIIALTIASCKDCAHFKPKISPESSLCKVKLIPNKNGHCAAFNDGKNCVNNLQRKWSNINVNDQIRTTITDVVTDDYKGPNASRKMVVKGTVIFKNRHYLTVKTSKGTKHTLQLADVIEGITIEILPKKETK